jgi:nucleoside-diphosphate-sugar epimerase
MARGETVLGWLAQSGVELVRGDVLDLPSFAAAARACDVVFHTAAVVTTTSRRLIHPYDAFRIPNVDGTRNAIAAARQAGARLLHLSSVAVYGSEARYASSATGRPVDEETPFQPLPERAFYSRSKRESEALVLEAHAKGELWATAVRPSVIYGQRDRQFVPRIAKLLRLRVAPVVDGGVTTLAVVHAANVADGAVRAATTEAAGGAAFNLANDFDVTLARFYRLAALGLSTRVHVVSLPRGVAARLLAVAKFVARRLGGAAMGMVSTSSIDFVSRNNPFSSDRARRILGWSPTVTPETGVPEAFRWWKEHHGAR